MRIFNYLKIGFYTLVLFWILLSALKFIDNSISFFYLGSLSIYLSIENLFKLYAHFYTEYKNEKLYVLDKKYKSNIALSLYCFYMIGFYLVMGLILIYLGMRGIN